MGRSFAQNIFLNAALDIGLELEFRVGKSHWHKAQITRYRRQKKDYRVRFEHTHSEQWVCVRSLVCGDQYRFVVRAELMQRVVQVLNTHTRKWWPGLVTKFDSSCNQYLVVFGPVQLWMELNPSEKGALWAFDKQPQAHERELTGMGKRLQGSWVKMQWPDDQKWYRAQVKEFNSETDEVCDVHGNIFRALACRDTHNHYSIYCVTRKMSPKNWST